MQPGGGKKDKKAPSDPKQLEEGSKKKEHMLKDGKNTEGEKSKTAETKEHDEQLKAGLDALDKLTKKLNDDGATKKEIDAGISGILVKHKVFKTLRAVEKPEEGIWEYDYTASPESSKKGPAIEKDLSEVPPWLDMVEIKPPKKRGSGFTQMRKGYVGQKGTKKDTGVGKTGTELLGVATYDKDTGEVILYVETALKDGNHKVGYLPVGNIPKAVLDSTMERAVELTNENSKGISRDETWWKRQIASNFGTLIEDEIRVMVSSVTGQTITIKKSGSAHGPDWVPTQLLLNAVSRMQSLKPEPELPHTNQQTPSSEKPSQEQSGNSEQLNLPF